MLPVMGPVGNRKLQFCSQLRSQFVINLDFSKRGSPGIRGGRCRRIDPPGVDGAKQDKGRERLSGCQGKISPGSSITRKNITGMRRDYPVDMTRNRFGKQAGSLEQAFDLSS